MITIINCDNNFRYLYAKYEPLSTKYNNPAVISNSYLNVQLG